MNKKWSWWLGLSVLAVILSFVEWRAPLPTGTLNVQVAGVMVIVVALGVNVTWSFGTLILVLIATLVGNLHDWWMILPILLSLLVVSFLLRGRSSLDRPMSHSQAIFFGLVSGLSQLIGMLVIVVIQTMLITNRWDELTAVLGMAVPVAILNGLLDCLFIPPLTIWVRHYTADQIKKK